MIVGRKISVQAVTALLAAFAAVVLLAAAPSPAAALNWSLPATDLSDGPANNAYRPQVAVAVDGTTTVVWERWDGFNDIVQARTRPAGSSTFGAAVNLSAAGGNATAPQVAVAVDGATTVVWERSNGSQVTVQASTRPAGSDTFGDAENLSDPALGDAYEPQVAVAAGGETTVVWYHDNGANDIIQASTRPAGGTFPVPADVVNLSAAGGNGDDQQLAVAADGTTTVIWRRSSRIQASTRPAGGTFPVPGDVVNLSAAGATAPQVAVGVDGATTVVWRRNNGSNNIVQASTRPAGSSAFGAVVEFLSAEGRNAYDPQVAVGANGATTVVWTRRNDSGDDIVQARTRPAGSDTEFGDVVNLSTTGQDAYDPQVAVGVDGATTVVWYRWDGSNNIVQARTRPAGSDTFADVVNLSTEGYDSESPQVAVGVDGAATAVWWRAGPGYVRIQESTSPGTPYLLTLTRSGAGSGSVSSSPAGIDCGLVCSYPFSLSTSVTLTASPTAGSSFAGWSGSGCSGTSTCTVTMLGARAVTAEFAVVPPVPPGRFDLSISKSGTGGGTVTSSPAGIDCGAACSESLVDGSSVTLTASPTTGSSFAGWSGSGCSGTSTCTVIMSEARAVDAKFTKLPSNLFAVRSVKAGASALVSMVRVPGPGTLTQRVTRGRLTAAVLTVCKTSGKATKAGRVKLTCKLNAATRAALRQRSLRVSVKTTFTPTGGSSASKTQAVTLKSQRPPPYTG